MERYELNLDQITDLLNRVIDLFLKYEYEEGHDEPRARMEAIQEIVRGMASEGDGQ